MWEESRRVLAWSVCHERVKDSRNSKSLFYFFCMRMADQMEVSQAASQLDWLVGISEWFPLCLPS